MSTAKTAGNDSSLNFDELFAGDQNPAGAAATGGEENLEELEAFLDEFEKNLDADTAKVAQPAPQPPQPETAAAAAPARDGSELVSEAGFAEPAQAEQLVQGLLKEDELDLDVQAEATVPAAPAATAPAQAAPVEEVAEFEPELSPDVPIAPPAFIHAAAAPARTVAPPAAAGFSRIGFILALVLGGVALLVSIGAGWMAWNANHAVQALGQGARPSAPDPELAKLRGELGALRQQVEGLAKVVEGPMGRMADAYPRDMEQLQNRVTELEKAAPKPEPSASAPPAAPAQPTAAPQTAAPQTVAPQTVAPQTAAPQTAAPQTAAPQTAAPQTAAPGSAAAPATAAPHSRAPATPSKAPAPQAGERPPAAAGSSATVPTRAAEASKGPWVVYLNSSDEKPLAERQLARARAQGIVAELTRSRVNGKTWYRVTVRGFATAEAARAYAAGEAKKIGFDAAWIGRE